MSRPFRKRGAVLSETGRLGLATVLTLAFAAIATASAIESRQADAPLDPLDARQAADITLPRNPS